MSSPVRKLSFSKTESDHSRFLALPASGQDCSLLLSIETWNAHYKWSARIEQNNFTFPITLLCHLQTGGPVCYITPDPACTPEEQTLFLRKHQECCNNNSALIVQMVPIPRSPAFDYYLAPIWGTGLQSEDKAPAFAVYAVGNRYIIDFLLSKVIHARRLPVVFDLDETLIKAKTLSNFSDQYIAKDSKTRREKIERDQSLSQADKATLLNQMKKEIIMLRQDAVSLQSYKDDNVIYINDGKRAVPEYPEYIECPFYPEDPSTGQLGALTSVTRPVIRPQPDLIFTRIRPSDKDTSMVLRIRPYWREVRSLLTGGMDNLSGNNDPSSSAVGSATAVNGNATPLIEAFVCTAAQTEYAHEVWRILDRSESLISHTRWTKRILTKAGTQKCLGLTLKLPDSVFSGNSVMPYAVILDDLLTIWEPKVQDQVIQVSKWDPYQEYGRVTLSREHWERAQAGLEMLKLGGVLRDLQKEMFDQIDSQKAGLPPGNIVTVDLTQVDASYAASFAPPPWTSRILPRVLETAIPLPLPAEALAAITAREERIKEKKAADAAAAATAILSPQDPRIAARTAAAAAAAAAAQSQKEEEQQREEPAEFNPETDGDVFANWGKMVTTNAEEEASKNKRKRSPAPSATASAVDDDGEEMESSSLENDASDILRDRELEMNVQEEEEEEQQGPARKKAHLSKEDPIILLSQAAQSQGKHLVTTTERGGNGGFFTIIKADNKRIGFAHGLSVEEARRNAAVNALEDLQGGAGGGETLGLGPPAPAPIAAAQVPVVNDGSDKIVYFDKASDRIRDLYPATGFGQKVIYKELTQSGDLVKRFQCIVRRDRGSYEPELTAVGVGDNYYIAKREAARILLTQLGYQVV